MRREGVQVDKQGGRWTYFIVLGMLVVMGLSMSVGAFYYVTAVLKFVVKLTKKLFKISIILFQGYNLFSSSQEL